MAAPFSGTKFKAWLRWRMKPRHDRMDDEKNAAESIKEEFAHVMKNLGVIRGADRRAIGITVTDAFDEIHKSHSWEQFAQWVEGRYGLTSGRDVAGNHKAVYLYWRDLKRFSRRFSWWDRVLIQFNYSDDWRRIESFHASIQWTLG